MSGLVDIEKQNSAWVLTLNRPEKRNALNAEMVEQLMGAIDEAEVNKVDLLVLRGHGKNFCAGFDFTDFEQSSEGDLLWRFVRIEQLLQRIYSSTAMTVACAHGANFGAGVDLLVACKHRVASADASFRMPGLKFGLVLGTRRLASLIGPQKAREIQQVAQTLDAAEAQSVGLVQEIAEPASWADVIERQEQAARSLCAEARVALYQAVTRASDDEDLSALVRSVVHPGLKQRIARYRAGE